MTTSFELVPIGHVRSDNHDAGETPNQPTRDGMQAAEIVLDERYVDGLDGLTAGMFVWVISLLDRPAGPAALRIVKAADRATGRLSGVFASRYPNRPNPIGISLVRVRAIDANIVSISGVDLLDGTPILDIKPWFDDCDVPWEE
jgi:tRNA-Thr(GGU) m(6)t(6)A37 methyltransferase TsaA